MKMLAFVASLLALPAAVHAAPEGSPPHGPPPQAAIDACAGRAANDSCEMSFPDGHSATGTCRSGPDGAEALASHRAHHAGEHGQHH